MNIDKLKSVIQKANPEIIGQCDFCNGKLGKLKGDLCGVCGNDGQSGRPIRLADVLLAIGRAADKINVGGDGAFNCLAEPLSNWTKCALWNLKDDNLDNQSDECKEFLSKLLVPESLPAQKGEK